MASFRETYINFALLGLMVFSLISFISVTQLNNNVNDTILNDSILNRSFSSLGTDLGDLQTQSNSSRESYEADIPERGFGSLIVFAIVGVGNTFTGMITGVYNILIDLPATKLGVPKIVFQVLGSILMVSLILLTWRVYRAGS